MVYECFCLITSVGVATLSRSDTLAARNKFTDKNGNMTKKN